MIAVSPAYAGIDRAHPALAHLCASFPRIRGDRPAIQRGALVWSEFPPHTRGSTPAGFIPPGGFGVSPAYAGIDRAW